MTQQPSVGRVVHYVSHGTPPRGDGSQAYPAACRAAIVTQVHADEGGPDDGGYLFDRATPPPTADAGLCVLNPSGQFFHERLPFDEGTERRHPHGVEAPRSPLCDGLDHAPGSWHWPARVGA